LQHLDAGIAKYTPEQRRAPVFRSAQDPGVACRSYSALSLWQLGFPDRALARAQDGLALALQLKHPFSIAFARLWLAYIFHFRRDAAGLREQAEAALTLATEQGIPLWAAKATIHRGSALTLQQCGNEGLADLQKGIAAWRATGANGSLPYYYTILAEAFAGQGRPSEGMQWLDEAHALVNRTDDHYWEAEIHRLRGLLLLQGSMSSQSEAETRLGRALEIARHQQAKSLELRAATDLARVWREQGNGARARDLLAPVYGWFTEGFDTFDLKEARTLLEGLNG
jgi:predicted ATPase